MGGAAGSAGLPEPRAGWRDAPSARSSSEPAELRPTWRERLRYAVDLAVAFATLRDDNEHDSAHAPVDAVHPHRTPLRPPTRPRRPGAAVPPKTRCLSPVEGLRPAHPRPRPDRSTLEL